MPSRRACTTSAAAVSPSERFTYPIASDSPRPNGGGPNTAGPATPGPVDAGRARPGPGVERIWTGTASFSAERLRLSKYSEEELQAQLQARENQVREHVVGEAEAKLRKECEAALQRQRQAVAEALQEFEGERRAYFERAEAEVVQLALAIARKILHREAQIDPASLSAAVRATLEKVAEGSAVQLHVADNEVLVWRRAVAEFKTLQAQPEVVGDSALAPGRCVITTDVGSAQLSLEAQLGNIEEALLDLAIHQTATHATVPIG